MPEIFIPEKSRAEDILLEERILAELGVDGYEKRKNPLTGLLEVIAPEGMGFELGREFGLATDPNDIVVWRGAVTGTALQQRENSELEASDGTFNDRPTIDTFVGTRLHIGIKHPNNRTIRNGDGWSSYFTKEWYHKDSDSDRPIVTLYVAGDVDAWYEGGLMPYMWQKGHGVMDWQTAMPDVPNSLLYWRIPVAEGDHLRTTLQVVPHQVTTDGLSVVERDDRDNELWLPYTGHWSDYAAFNKPNGTLALWNLDRQRRYDEPVPEEEYDGFMRFMRQRGWTMERDPLKNVTILEGEPYDPDNLDLDAVVAEAIRKGQKPPTYQEARTLERKLHNEIVWKRQAERLRSEIAVVAGTVSLHQLARENTGDWMREEREAILNRKDPNW